MRTLEKDVAIVGAGTAGMSARQQVAKAGKSYVLIEAGELGTTCALDGCMPSKLLVAAADAAHGMRQAPVFGVRPGLWQVQGSAVMDRVRRMRDHYVRSVTSVLDDLADDELVRGHARFVAPDTLQVGEEVRVRAGAIVLATGARPVVPPPLRDLGERLLTHRDVFEIGALPTALAVVGAGPIGLELGQAFARLGARACILDQADRLPMFDDEAVEAAALGILREEVQLHLGAEVLEARGVGDAAQLTYRDQAGNERTETFDFILSAAGRNPNLDGLDLAQSGLELDERGVPVHDPLTLQCGDAPVFIAGDANARLPVLHEAADDGRTAGLNAAGHPTVSAHPRRTRMHVVFTDPQIAMVGQSLSELDPEEAELCQVDWSDQGRAQVMGRNQGLCRIYGSREKGRILGAEMIGPDAEHLAHLLAWSIQRGDTVQEVLAMPFYHPVLEEGLRTALVGLATKLKLTEPPPEKDLDCGPGT